MEDKTSFNTQLIEVPEAGSKEYGGEIIIKKNYQKYFGAKFEKTHRTPSKIAQHLETLYQNYKTSKIKGKHFKTIRSKTD